jgi:hypothetical protein
MAMPDEKPRSHFTESGPLPVHIPPSDFEKHIKEIRRGYADFMENYFLKHPDIDDETSISIRIYIALDALAFWLAHFPIMTENQVVEQIQHITNCERARGKADPGRKGR